ncbi:MAG: response regulator transcription factor [Gammaproteobacteria bacterium]
MRILLIEDDELLGEGVSTALADAGHVVDWLTDGASGLTALGTEAFELVLLDLGLPRMDGMSMLRKLRAADGDVPVIILTARDTLDDRVAGLDAGADDYLVKPFELDELHARIRAVARRRAGRADTRVVHGNLVLDPVSRQATWQGEPLELRRREYDILEALVENAGRVMSRGKLEQRLYGWRSEVESNAVEVHIHHLRRKLSPEFIRTIRGVGYMVEKS